VYDEPNNDVNLSVIGTGCGASCGLSCGVALLMFLVISIIGARAALTSPVLFIFAFLLGSLVSIALGYIVARAAMSRGATVNFHVIIFGIIQMVLGLFAWVLPHKNFQLANDIASLLLMFRIIGWLLIIPLMLLGASWAKEEEIT
jgi:hypothetical protein